MGWNNLWPGTDPYAPPSYAPPRPIDPNNWSVFQRIPLPSDPVVGSAFADLWDASSPGYNPTAPLPSVVPLPLMTESTAKAADALAPFGASAASVAAADPFSVGLRAGAMPAAWAGAVQPVRPEPIDPRDRSILVQSSPVGVAECSDHTLCGIWLQDG
jgi:hypothetical protein